MGPRAKILVGNINNLPHEVIFEGDLRQFAKDFSNFTNVLQSLRRKDQLALVKCHLGI